MTGSRADWRKWVLSAYAVFYVWIAIVMGQPNDWSWLVGLIPFLLWGLLPVAIFCFGKRHRTAKIIGAAIVALVGVGAFLHTAFVAEADAQNALIFLVAPLLQLVVAFLWLAAIWAYAKFASKGTVDA